MNGRVLLTGFEPFGGDVSNPSEQIARRLHGTVIGGREVVGRVLPVVFGESRRQLAAALSEVGPAVVICLGLAANRKCVSLERVAINVDDARIPDNQNQQPIDQPIEAEGPAAYWTGLPIKAACARLHAAGVDAEISQSAGTYVCNHVFYGLMHALSSQPGVRGGFVHVPPPDERVGLDQWAHAIALIVETALLVEQDSRQSGGAIS